MYAALVFERGLKMHAARLSLHALGSQLSADIAASPQQTERARTWRGWPHTHTHCLARGPAAWAAPPVHCRQRSGSACRSEAPVDPPICT